MNYPKLFAVQDALYEKIGLRTTPVKPGEKKPAIKDWPQAANFSADQRETVRQRHAADSIGLLAGTMLPTGNRFGFIDIDDDGFVPIVKAILPGSTVAKKGQKGLTIFVQCEPDLLSTKIKQGKTGKPTIEIFIDTGMTVAPPSLHPSGAPYAWTGTPLTDVDPCGLPILTREKYKFLKVLGSNSNAHAIVEGGPSVQAHDPMLRLTASIWHLADDHEWLASVLNSLFHPNYGGNTKEETLGMLRSAKEKGLRSAAGYEPGAEGPVPVGYTREGNFVLQDKKRQIMIVLSASQLLTHQHLLAFAPLPFWVEQFPSDKLFNALRAGTTLIEACKEAGPFNPADVRGRGVWREGDRIVLNFGSPLPPDLKCRYLCFEPLNVTSSETFETERLLTWLQQFKWRNAQDAMLLLGWLAIAPICGVLLWRPHVFLYGPPRSGKTTIHTLVAKILSPLVISADGQSTEAGVRQKLGPDSIAVILDEFESDQRSYVIYGVLRLARSASSAETPVLRGTPEGKAMQFSLRTTFFFAAVNPRGMSEADDSRILKFELLMHDNDESVARQLIEGERYFSDKGAEWCGYMIGLAHYVTPAIDKLGNAMLGVDRRHRQNMSTLLGGAFVALHKRVPTEDEAKEWALKYQPAIEVHSEALNRNDALECLDHLLAYPTETATIGFYLGILKGDVKNNYEKQEGVDAPRVARNFDIVVKRGGNDDGLYLRNRSPAIERVFKGTRWEGYGWMTALKKLEGVFTAKNPLYFSSAGGKSRAIGLPYDYIPDIYTEIEY